MNRKWYGAFVVQCVGRVAVVGSRPGVWLRIFLFLVLGLALFTRPSPSPLRAAPTAVGDNAIFLTGSRPPAPGDLIDLSGYIEIPHSPALNPNSGAITIEAWVKRTGTDRHETLVGNGWQNSYWLGFSPSGKIRFTPYGSGGLVDGVTTIQAGVWTHIAVTYDGVTRRYYINGALDLNTTEKPGALKGAAAGEFLGIGFDRNDSFIPNYFGGGIDNVRIWNIARSAPDIQASMFQTFGGPTPNLLAEWSFNGDLTDAAGNHNGVSRRNVQFVNDGALPKDIRIPLVDNAPTLNGTCSPGEYANALELTVGRTSAFIQHTGDKLWICFERLEGPSAAAHVYLDPDYTRVDPAQNEHLRLTVDNGNVTQASRGQGDNTYATTTDVDALWDAMYTNCCGEFPTARAEFRIDAQLVNGLDGLFGLALGETTGLRGGLQLWPALASSILPSTWSSAIPAGTGPDRTFTGQVVYQPPDPKASPTGVYGVTVRLIGYDLNGSEAVVAMTQSAVSGAFTLTTDDDFSRHRLELGAPPKGYLLDAAVADAPGTGIDPRTIDFGDVAGGVFGGSRFVLTDVRPWVVDNHHGPYFLIVTRQAVIDSKVLADFVDFKTRMGFAVEVKSLESIEATMTGTTRIAKIRAYAQSRRAALGERFRYLMLVGAPATIPHALFYAGFTGHDSNGEVDLTACLAPEGTAIDQNSKGIKLKRTDWYFADLTTNFDPNGNGCLLDGTHAKAEDLAPGYTPDTLPTLTVHVAVGRIPLDNPATIQTALNNIMHFEMQSEQFKRRTLLAMSNVFIKGQYWSPKDDATGAYTPCPLKEADKDKTSVNKNCQSATNDAGKLGEFIRADFLNPWGYQSIFQYEAAKPPGATPVQSLQPLTYQNVQSQLGAQAHGFVHVAGHGGPGGVSRTYWEPANNNGMVDAPTAPLADGKSASEIKGGAFINKDTFGSLTPYNQRGAIFMASACATLSPTDANNIGATVLSQGHGIAWIGALNTVNARYSWTSPQHKDMGGVSYHIAKGLLDDHLRLGDALWRGLDHFTSQGIGGSADVSITLYGDPTLSYWGNPGGQTTLAAWPMMRYDARGFGYTPLTGPELPKKLWEYDGAAADTAMRAPVVSNNGEVIVAHGNFVDVLRQGKLHQRLSLDAQAYGTPAIAADGTLYVMDVAGNLYAFPYASYLLFPFPLKDIIVLPAAEPETPAAVDNLGSRYRRWKTGLGGSARTSPTVGADGYIGAGINGKVLLVRPDGRIFREYNVPGAPMHALALDARRNLYVATGAGYAARIDFFCKTGTCVQSQQDAGASYSTPPLLAYGSVYIGRDNGQVVRISNNAPGFSVAQSFQANGKITAGPVAGPGGQILVGTAAGTLYSLTQNLSVRWQRNISASVESIPAFSADALYVVSGGVLRAFHPFSGAPLWSRNLGNGVGDGSAAVGFGRELYLQTRSGKVFGYGEGWVNQIVVVKAESVLLEASRNAIRVTWLHNVPPVEGAQSAAGQQDEGEILIQRRGDDGPWIDLAILPPGTSVFVDTNVMPNVVYAYRVQVLDPNGDHSEMTGTLVDVRSLPSLPQAPTWIGISAEGADALRLEWESSADDVVNAYRIERSDQPGGPFAVIGLASGEAPTLLDVELSPATAYYYQVIALNEAGESPASNVEMGTTRQQSLPGPENVTAGLLDDGRIRVSWDPGPAGVQAVVEHSQGALAGFESLATTAASGGEAFQLPGEPDVYIHRVKFVQGDNESPWVEAPVIMVGGEEALPLYMPILAR